MLSPKRTKYRKQQRGKFRKQATKGNAMVYGDFGLVAMEPKWITNRQLEAARIAMTRHIKRGGKIWLRIFPDKPFTKKPAEVRMGKGKGSPEGWEAVIRPGRILYEMQGVSKDMAKEAMRLAAHKLAVKTKFIERSDSI